jgi:hypothetical protein
MGIIGWFRETAQSIYQGVSDFISAAPAVYANTKATLKLLYDSGWSSGWFAQSWQGFQRIFYSSIIPPMIAFPQTARVLSAGRCEALLRLAPVLLYRAGVRPLVGLAVRTAITKNALVESAAVNMLDVAAFYIFMRRALTGYIDTTVYNLNMAKASADETQVPNPGENPLVKPCMHDGKPNEMGQTTAGVFSSIYYIGNVVALNALANNIPYGQLVTLPLQMLLIGRALLEFPLAAAGNCTEHRLEALNKNNPYAMGLGGSYILLEYLLSKAIELGTGASGYFVNEALASLLSLQFIMALNLTRNDPLPGTAPGKDVFFIGRGMSDALLQKGYAWIGSQFKGDPAGDWYQDLKRNARAKISTPLAHKVRHWVINENLQDWEKFALRKSSRLFLDLYGESIIGGLKWVQAQRKYRSYKVVNKVGGWLPEFIVASNDVKMLNIMMLPELKQPLQDWLDFFVRVSDPNFALPKVVNQQNDNRVEIVDDYNGPHPRQELFNLDHGGVVSVNPLRRSDSRELLRLIDREPLKDELFERDLSVRARDSNFVAPNVVSKLGDGRIEILDDYTPSQPEQEPLFAMLTPPPSPSPQRPISKCRQQGLFGETPRLRPQEPTTMNDKTDEFLRQLLARSQ